MPIITAQMLSDHGFKLRTTTNGEECMVDHETQNCEFGYLTGDNRVVPIEENIQAFGDKMNQFVVGHRGSIRALKGPGLNTD